MKLSITSNRLFSSEHSSILLYSADGTIKLWDVESGALLWKGWHTDLIEGLAFAPDGQRLASCADDATIRLWDVTSGRCLCTLEGHTDHVCALAWSPDGRTVASGGFDDAIWLWNVEPCNLCRRLE